MRSAMTSEQRAMLPLGAEEIAFKGFGNLDGDDWYTEALFRTADGRFFVAVDSARRSVYGGASIEQWISDDEVATWLHDNGFVEQLRRYFPVA